MQQMKNHYQNKKTPYCKRLLICCLELVSQDIFLRNSLKKDLIKLYFRLVDLGMEYRNGKVRLADLEGLVKSY